jgi:FkbM family methyltransferase
MTELKTKELEFRGNTFKICYREEYPQDASWFSFDDEAGVRDRDWNIQPGDVVFDIGSAYGSYALTALASGAERVWCFNPNGEENIVLLESARANGWDHKVTVYEGGLWSCRGFLRDTDQHFSDTHGDGQFFVRPLDGLFDSVVERLDWLKMDVEGAEEHVLRGAEKTIARFKPRILVEQHKFKDATIAERVTALLETFGYRLVSDHPYHGVSHSLYEPVAK